MELLNLFHSFISFCVLRNSFDIEDGEGTETIKVLPEYVIILEHMTDVNIEGELSLCRQFIFVYIFQIELYNI